VNFSIGVIAVIITRGIPADVDAEYAGKPGAVDSLPDSRRCNLTSAGQQIRILWYQHEGAHEEAEEGVSRDEIHVVAFLFHGRKFSGVRACGSSWLMIFPNARARVEANPREKVKARGKAIELRENNERPVARYWLRLANVLGRHLVEPAERVPPRVCIDAWNCTVEAVQSEAPSQSFRRSDDCEHSEHHEHCCADGLCGNRE
jgi:hypothetical protein